MNNIFLNYFATIFELAGNFGLSFLLAIFVINLYAVWQTAPKKVQYPSGEFVNSKRSQRVITLLRIKMSLVAGLVASGIILTFSPALWLKAFSAGLILIAVISLLFCIWHLRSNNPVSKYKHS
jgi:hypothetical protein